jgi:hypothetical protein
LLLTRHHGREGVLGLEAPRPCLWVPAAQCERVAGAQVYRVYGGVALIPQITVLKPQDAGYAHLRQSVRQPRQSARISGDYLAQGERASQALQAGAAAPVRLPLFLRQMQTRQRQVDAGLYRLGPPPPPVRSRWQRMRGAVQVGMDRVAERFERLGARFQRTWVYRVLAWVGRGLERVARFFNKEYRPGILNVSRFPRYHERVEGFYRLARAVPVVAGGGQAPAAVAAVPKPSVAFRPPMTWAFPTGGAAGAGRSGGSAVPPATAGVSAEGAGSGRPPGGGDSSGSDSSDEEPLPSEDTARAPRTWSVKARLKVAQLPTKGRIRYVPPDSYEPSEPLPRGRQNGFRDKFNAVKQSLRVSHKMKRILQYGLILLILLGERGVFLFSKKICYGLGKKPIQKILRVLKVYALGLILKQEKGHWWMSRADEGQSCSQQISTHPIDKIKLQHTAHLNVV